MIPTRISDDFLRGIHSHEPVVGLTHRFYRYPARFSPRFARAAILAFTRPGDLVLDPFMGGGTTLVEARVLGRRAIGVDINQLATFVADVKTRLFGNHDIDIIQNWASQLAEKLNLRNSSERATEWIAQGYLRNLNGKKTWAIRKTLELALLHVGELPSDRQRRFARCILLKTGQWALDCRKDIPSGNEFRRQFLEHVREMCEGALEFSKSARSADQHYRSRAAFRTLCLNRSAIGIDQEPLVARDCSPKLILTSPPYPGVHVLYHRWQVQGRRETPAPFWITDSFDGNGAAFYTFGDRQQRDLIGYYNHIQSVFASLARIADKKTMVVQMIAFADPSWQLRRYLSTLDLVGFSEIKFPALANSGDGRLWRRVPNRKWYADQRGTIASSKEVVLFHRLGYYSEHR